jgi:hypothetical protein
MTNKTELNFWEDLSPEAKLLLNSAKLSFTEDQREEIKLLINEVTDWKLFQTLAFQTSLAPLCYKSLVTSRHYNIPKETASFLKTVYSKTLAQNVLILDEYDRLKVILDQAKIPNVPLKGVRLIGDYYKDAGLRNTSDVDLLFRKCDINAVRKLMKASGYNEYLVDEHLCISELTKNPSPYQYSKNNVSIDFHILLNRSGKISLNIEDYWNSANKKEDSYAYELNPNLEFIHLCYHFYKHIIIGASKLIWFYDLQIFIENNKLEWVKIDAFAKEFNCQKEVFAIVQALEIMYSGKGMPEELADKNDKNYNVVELIKHHLTLDPKVIKKKSIFSKLFRETSHLPLSKKFIVAALRAIPSMYYLNTYFKAENNYFRGLKNRYLYVFRLK